MSTKFMERMQSRQLQDKYEEQIGKIRARLPRFKEDHDAIREALITLKEEKLYRLKYKTLDECVQAEFGFGRQWAYKLISDKGGGSMSTKATSSSQAGSKPEEADLVVKSIKAFLKTWNKRIDELGRRKQGGKNRAVQLKASLHALFADFWKMHIEPDKPIPDPSPAPCKYCGMPCLWVTTENWKRMPVDEVQTVSGNYDLRGGLAIRVEQSKENGRRLPLYQSHFLTCPKRNGRQEAPLPD